MASRVSYAGTLLRAMISERGAEVKGEERDETGKGGMMFPSKWHFVFRLAEDFTDAWDTINKNMFVWRNELGKFREAKRATRPVSFLYLLLSSIRIDRDSSGGSTNRRSDTTTHRGVIESLFSSIGVSRRNCHLFYGEIIYRSIDSIVKSNVRVGYLA